jgi:HAE1 family hydrophobic/amphiphilic exporter-1/multidrug efflux pump
VLPLAVSTGAGAGGQNAIGRSVVGGMLSATVLGIFLVPVFFVVVLRLFGHEHDAKTDDHAQRDADGDAGPQGDHPRPAHEGA